MTTPTSLGYIRGTFADLDAWGVRARTVNEGAPGSDLDGDDAEAIGWRTSQLAVAGLATGRNHLHGVRLHIEAHEIFPDVTGTLVRGALLGAAQAVWMLAPDDRDTRQVRSRVVAMEVLENHRKFLVDLLSLSPGHADTKTVQDHVERRLSEITAKRNMNGETLGYKSTDIIEQAAEYVMGTGTKAEARAEWRRFSGNAHGLPWALLGGSGTQVTSAVDANGVATFEAGGSSDDVVNGYALAYRLVKDGWALFDRRAAARSSSSQSQ